jgi:hypothetical protein
MVGEKANLASETSSACVEGLTEYADVACGWLCESREKSQECALACPIGTNDDERFTRSEREVQAVQNVNSPERTAKAMSLEHECAVMRLHQSARRARRGGKV